MEATTERIRDIQLNTVNSEFLEDPESDDDMDDLNLVQRLKRFHERLERQREEFPQALESPEPLVVLGHRVPMSTQEELDNWIKFQELHKKNVVEEPAIIEVDEDKMEVDLDHPIVPVLVKFAVETFNKICLKAGVSQAVVHSFDIFEVKYLRAPNYFVFYITLDTDNGVYEPNVAIFPDDTKTLVQFGRPDRETIEAVKMKSRKAAELEEMLKQAKKAAEGEELLQKICEGEKKAKNASDRGELYFKLKQVFEAVKGKKEANGTVFTGGRKKSKEAAVTGKKTMSVLRKKACDTALTGEKKRKEAVLTGNKRANNAVIKGKKTVGAVRRKAREIEKAKAIAMVIEKAVEVALERKAEDSEPESEPEKPMCQAMEDYPSGYGLGWDILHGGYNYLIPIFEEDLFGFFGFWF